MTTRKWLTAVGAALALATAGVGVAHAEMVVELEGMQVPAGITMDGLKLTLNGASVRKRSYFKPDVVALYLTNKVSNLEDAMRMPGPKKVRVWVLREFSGSVISRFFLGDFKQVATDTEFKQLINEIGQIGAIYGAVPRVFKGDVVDIDWTPGKGLTSTLNGKLLSPTPINSEKMYEMTLRIIAGAAAAPDMRESLLGQRPMQFVDSKGR
jgi:hypothetical protein